MLNNVTLRSVRRSACISAALLAATAVLAPLGAAEHTLMPTPQTVHIGYFLATLKPVLTIDSGDIVTIESAASIVPDVVDKSGVVPPSAVPQYQRDIYGTVKDRGPGPHVLTGPIEISGAEPGDVLEVRILDVSLALDWGYNRQRPYTGDVARRVHRDLDADHPDRPPDQDRRGGEGRRGAGRPAVLRHHGRRARRIDGPHQQRPARRPHRQPRQQGPDRRHHAVHAGARAGRAVLGRRRARGAGSRRGRSHRDRDRHARQIPVHRAQGHEADLAARRDADALDRDGAASRTSTRR